MSERDKLVEEWGALADALALVDEAIPKLRQAKKLSGFVRYDALLDDRALIEERLDEMEAEHDECYRARWGKDRPARPQPTEE